MCRHGDAFISAVRASKVDVRSPCPAGTTIDLIQLNGSRWFRGIMFLMCNFLFRCPSTGMLVQGQVATSVDSTPEYVGMTCLACAAVHLVNPRTGKLVSEEVPSTRT